MRILLLLCLIGFAGALPARADLKIALIDTGQAFDAYYKTKDMAVRLAAKRDSYQREVEDLVAQEQTARQEAQSLDTAAKNPGNSVPQRKSDDTALANKVQELQALDQEIDEVRKARAQELKDALTQGHQEISDEMMKVITDFATAQGYDLVLDKSAVTENSGSLFVLISPQVIDLTAQIIAKLNSTANAK